MGKAKAKKTKGRNTPQCLHLSRERGCTLIHRGLGTRRRRLGRSQQDYSLCSGSCKVHKWNLYTDVMCVLSLHLNSMGIIPEAKEDAPLPCNPEQHKERNRGCNMQLKFVFIIYKSKNLHLEFLFLAMWKKFSMDSIRCGFGNVVRSTTRVACWMKRRSWTELEKEHEAMGLEGNNW